MIVKPIAFLMTKIGKPIIFIIDTFSLKKPLLNNLMPFCGKLYFNWPLSTLKNCLALFEKILVEK
jgi:hypothetical protein